MKDPGAARGADAQGAGLRVSSTGALSLWSWGTLPSQYMGVSTTLEALQPPHKEFPGMSSC